MGTVVADWYADRSVFVTGGTGFMGKVLLEKLLRSCPSIDKIYVLVRQKRGYTPAVRLSKMLKLKVFERVQKEAKEKLVLVEGNILEDNLGMCKKDLETLLSEVSIVFHGAATLKLEAGLRECIEHNTRATLRLLELATKMNKLEAFVHFSTAFCHSELEVLEDKVYPVPISPREILSSLEWMDDETVEFVTPKLLGHHPNCYTFSKRLAETLVNEYKDKLPVAIVRPSIVIPALHEPVPGWVDSLNGPIGILVAAGKGVLRSMLCETQYRAEVVPVDLAVNAIIAVAWHTANHRTAEKIPVFNLSIADKVSMTWGEVLDIGIDTFRDYPFEPGLWLPGGGPTTSVMTHVLTVFFLQVIPAYFVDFLMLIIRKKPFMVRVQKRIAIGMSVLQYFTMRRWHFKLDSVVALSDSLTAKDKESFYLAETQYDIKEYFISVILGARQYCMKEPLESLPRARFIHKILFVLDLLVKIALGVFASWCLMWYIIWLRSTLDSLWTTMRPPIIN